MSDTFDATVGRRLRWRRKALGLSLKDISPACGVRFQQIAKYEAGSAQVSAAILWKLATALEVDIGFFFEGLSPSGSAEDRARL
ncbi:helix-turn-helix transcriptional regulator [Phenylobacterium sp.]|uniref:helix-turn-helix domain-containing protein n=1 Tax=Phenylobacterium sp. TaxID=1871053 RepID=UPI002BC15DCD|nr:helix-turn-helix transcriptional regulator [Phenylobacterium sp.]HLZ74449.1 helix-turn-helix transcriptional regulator [Phenylobacterium sp.]